MIHPLNLPSNWGPTAMPDTLREECFPKLAQCVFLTLSLKFHPQVKITQVHFTFGIHSYTSSGGSQAYLI